MSTHICSGKKDTVYQNGIPENLRLIVEGWATVTIKGKIGYNATIIHHGSGNLVIENKVGSNVCIVNTGSGNIVFCNGISVKAESNIKNIGTGKLTVTPQEKALGFFESHPNSANIIEPKRICRQFEDLLCQKYAIYMDSTPPALTVEYNKESDAYCLTVLASPESDEENTASYLSSIVDLLDKCLIKHHTELNDLETTEITIATFSFDELKNVMSVLENIDEPDEITWSTYNMPF